MNKLLAIDTETGGFDPVRSPLLSVAAVTEDGAEFHQLVLPPRQWWRLGRRQRVEPEAVRVNGYSCEEWKKRGAVELEEASWRFLVWLVEQQTRLGPLTPVAHNAGFDRAFVERMARVCGVLRMPFSHRWECSMAGLGLARRAGLVNHRACSLDALCEVSGTTRQEPHDALSDARACLHGYQWLLRLVGAKKEGGGA
jgi:DNA polymerase III epsilon subunit-like protein